MWKIGQKEKGKIKAKGDRKTNRVGGIRQSDKREVHHGENGTMKQICGKKKEKEKKRKKEKEKKNKRGKEKKKKWGKWDSEANMWKIGQKEKEKKKANGDRKINRVGGMRMWQTGSRPRDEYGENETVEQTCEK